MFTHMCKILWVINRHSDDPELRLDLGKIYLKSEDGKKEVDFDMSDIKKLIQQNALPTGPEYFGKDVYAKPFEFMDMLNYMFHGTLSDVSTHSLEWKNGKIVGGRDSWMKITGVMYPQGIFVDPRINQGNNGYRSDDSGLSIHTTNIDPMFLLTGVTSELAMNFDIHFDENAVQKKSIEFSKSQNTDGNIVISSNEDITIDEILEQFSNIKVDSGIYYIDGTAYQISNQTNNSYTFTKVNTGTSNVISKMFDIPIEIIDNDTYQPTTDLGGITIEELVKQQLNISNVEIGIRSGEYGPTSKILEIFDNSNEQTLAYLNLTKKDGQVTISLLSPDKTEINTFDNNSEIPVNDTKEIQSTESNEGPDIDLLRITFQNSGFEALLKELKKYKDYLIREYQFTEEDFSVKKIRKLSEEARAYLTTQNKIC